MNTMESEFSKRCRAENRKPVDQTMFKAKGHVEHGQTWEHKKTGVLVQIDSVRMMGACYVSFYDLNELSKIENRGFLARGEFLKNYKQDEIK